MFHFLFLRIQTKRLMFLLSSHDFLSPDDRDDDDENDDHSADSNGPFFTDKCHEREAVDHLAKNRFFLL